MIIDGKVVSASIRDSLKTEISEFIADTGITPGLAVVLVGDNPASQVYVRNKQRACEQLGIFSEGYMLSADTTQEALLDLLSELNRKETIHGILVQLPLPSHIDADRVISAILPQKDVDAFHPQNVGALTLGSPVFAPCTPAGIVALLDYYQISPEGKHCVIVGRSNIVGKPAALLMLSKNATVTVCHSRTKDLSSVTKEADILIAAIGKPNYITCDMVKEGAVVIDVGINRTADGKLCGDVDFAQVSQIASAITPVPGGVGPMTITMLMKNTLTAARMAVKGIKNN